MRHLRRHECGEGAGAGADFQHHIVGRKLGRIDEDVLQVEIDQEVLPVAGVDAQADFGEALLEEGEGLVGHEEQGSKAESRRQKAGGGPDWLFWLLLSAFCI